MRLYPRLAFDAMRKNKRLYLPFLLTCTGMVAIFYIISYLSYNPTIRDMRGGEALTSMMSLGSFVIGIFSLIFLFYTHSFLMRRRKREFGLYHILGMGKGNLAMLLLWQTGILAVYALVSGLALGIALSKLAELGLVRLLGGQTGFELLVSWRALGMTLLIFSVIFLLQYLSALLQIRRSSSVSLLRSEQYGEKPPRANWVLALLGLLLLCAAYYLAVSIEEPISALGWFFVAVVMVIAATYLLMIAGSVALCRLLQKRKRYYYKPNHFVSTASMAYRMKRNGAGLASICILATMVLVILSSTTSLFFGVEDALHTRFPRDMNVDFRMSRLSELEHGNTDRIGALTQQIVRDHGGTAQNAFSVRYLFDAAVLDGSGTLHLRRGEETMQEPQTFVDGQNCGLYILPLEDYNAQTHGGERLNAGEAMLYTSNLTLQDDTVRFSDGTSFSVVKRIDAAPRFGMNEVNAAASQVVMLVVPELSAAQPLVRSVGSAMSMRYYYGIDTGLKGEKQDAVNDELIDTVCRGTSLQCSYDFFNVESRESSRADYYSIYGGLFYLGVLLCVVFVCATVLIIYYKQVCEGYEDQARFDIMQKVGMTRREIRRSVNSQLLTVFFLPLLGAGLHLAFAFPMLRRLLMLFELQNVALFAWASVVTFAVFAVFYSIVYRVTSAAYYSIVSNQK